MILVSLNNHICQQAKNMKYLIVMITLWTV